MEKIMSIVEAIKSPNHRGLIAISVVWAFIGYVFLVIFRVIPAQNKDIVLPAAGFLAAKFGTIVDWNFGGSKDKSDQEKVETAKEVSKQDNNNSENQSPN
jgi:hypothetical protein